jgi:hypothetical protein
MWNDRSMLGLLRRWLNAPPRTPGPERLVDIAFAQEHPGTCSMGAAVVADEPERVACVSYLEDHIPPSLAYYVVAKCDRSVLRLAADEARPYWPKDYR